MLFQRLYNWIKYKTLPPSFLFKNRLFIERDSKHKRIFSNFGLSFRNSKWGGYEMSNIKSQFKNVYIRLLICALLLLIISIFLIGLKLYYVNVSTFNLVAFILWIGFDTLDYYLSFLVWVAAAFVTLIFNITYSYFFFTRFSSKTPARSIFSNKFLSNLRVDSDFNERVLYASKHDLSWFLHAWLTNNKSNLNSATLDNLFKTTVDYAWWSKYNSLFGQLFKTSSLLNLTNENLNIFNLGASLQNLKLKPGNVHFNMAALYFNNAKLLNRYSNVTLWYTIKYYKNYFYVKNAPMKSLQTLCLKNDWNLYNLNLELENYPFLLKSKTGLFFFDDFNYGQLNHFIFNFEELWGLNLFTKNQILGAKWNRWLYRYSILHRKILKNSHKLTTVKRLLNSGIYDSRIFEKNIWANEYFTKVSANGAFAPLFEIYYKNFYNSNNMSKFNNHCLTTANSGAQDNALNLLGFYETSYFWFLKRFYNFNTLHGNFIKSKLKNNNSTLTNLNFSLETKNNALTQYYSTLAYAVKLREKGNSSFSHFNNDISCFNKIYDDQNFEHSFKTTKDFFALMSENTILSKENLNTMYWITAPVSEVNKILFFTKSLNYDNFTKCSISSLSKKRMQQLNPVGFDLWLNYSLINCDNTQLYDLSFLIFFIY